MIDNSGKAAVSPPQVYTDLNSLQQIKAQAAGDKQGALKNIAHQFESMMMQMMMKSMREANSVFSDGDITASNEGKFYQDMFDSQLSVSLSQGRGFGIADAIMRQFKGRFPEQGDAAAKPSLDHSLATVPLNTAAIAAAARGQAGTMAPQDARTLNAIQDAIHRLFGGAGEDAATTDSKTAAAQLDGTPAKFVAALRPLARSIGAKLGVDSDVLLSQSALETGWGQKVIDCADGSSSFNFFNIKADDSWTGAVVKVPTIEYHDGVAVREWASFRAYGSPEESFADYARLIGENPRYQQALECGDNPRAYVKALAKAGYATDPQYAQKILNLFDSVHLRSDAATGDGSAQLSALDDAQRR